MSSSSDLARQGWPRRSPRMNSALRSSCLKGARGSGRWQHAGCRPGLPEHVVGRQASAYLTALCGEYTVPEAMVQVWATEMGQNNAWLRSLGGDPQEHQHPPAGIEFPDLPGADCVHKFHDGPDLWLLLHLEIV